MKVKNLKLNTHQQGATLVIVLFVIVLVVLIGTLSVRRSVSDLSVATSAQVEKLLFQTSDSALAAFELWQATPAGNPNDATSLLGMMTSEETGQPKGTEFSVCYSQQLNSFFSTDRLSVIQENGGGFIAGFQGGNCNPANSDNYVSARESAMTQIRLISPENTGILENMTEGTNIQNIKTEVNRICAYSVTVIPAFANNQSDAVIAGCFAEPMLLSVGDEKRRNNVPFDENNMTILDCFQNAGIPVEVHSSEYIMGSINVGTVGADSTGGVCA